MAHTHVLVQYRERGNTYEYTRGGIVLRESTERRVIAAVVVVINMLPRAWKSGGEEEEGGQQSIKGIRHRFIRNFFRQINRP